MKRNTISPIRRAWDRRHPAPPVIDNADDMDALSGDGYTDDISVCGFCPHRAECWQAETESSEIIDDDMDALSAETESSEIIDLDRLCRIRSVSEEWSPGLAVYGD